VPNQEHERERDQTYNYWYIPSAPRVNYSLLIMESVGMMKMATGDDSPSGRVPEQGPDWFLVAIEACGGGTPDLFCSPKVLGYMEIYRRKKSVRGATRGPRGWRARPGGWAPPLASCLPRSFPYVHSKSCFRSKNYSPEGFIPFGLRLIFFFCETLKQGEKQKLALGSGLIG
jgi:hypothetical protein